MEERLTIMQTEDGVTSLEREDLSVISYIGEIPEGMKEGDIVLAIVYSEDDIFFIGLDEEAMLKRAERRARRAARFAEE